MEKRKYITPTLKEVSFKTELGFAGSTDRMGLNQMEADAFEANYDVQGNEVSTYQTERWSW